MKLFLIIVVCFTCIVSGLSAQSDDEISSWLQDLDNDQFQVRKQATQQLSKVGPEKLERIIEHAEEASTEAGFRLAQVVKEVLKNTEIQELEMVLSTLQNLEQHESSKVRGLVEKFRDQIGTTEMIKLAEQYQQLVTQAVEEKKRGESHPKVISAKFVERLRESDGVRRVVGEASLGFLEEPDDRWKTDDPNAHPKILVYRVKWFKGGWSQWFIPGINDSDSKDATKLVWRHLYDHDFEYFELDVKYGPLSQRKTLLKNAG